MHVHYLDEGNAHVATLALGSQPRQRAYKGAGQD